MDPLNMKRQRTLIGINIARGIQDFSSLYPHPPDTTPEQLPPRLPQPNGRRAVQRIRLCSRAPRVLTLSI